MAKKEIYNSSITEIEKGVYMDCDPLNQPKGTRRFTLNAIGENLDGKNSVSNELSNVACERFPDGFIPIGDRYIGDDNTVVILTNTKGFDEIGIIDKNDKYKTLVHTGVLGLKVTNQCDIIFRIRRGKERVIYWVDGNALPRTLNLDRLHNFYNSTYSTYISGGGDPDTFVGEKWDLASFNLIKTYSLIPSFDKAEVVETGNILPGSYNFAIQLVDEDLNPTAWITTSNTINIYNDTTANPYERIRGSRNVQTASQSWDRTNKSIRLTLSNLDKSFPYYRVGIIRAAGNTGQPDKVLASELYSTSNSIFTYTGNDSALTEVAIENILIDNEIIFAPKHIDQLENRLILANGKGKGVNWCEMQKFASKIKTDLVTKQVILNSVFSDSNVKNPNSTFVSGGYMPGEVVSLGIVYLFDDGYLSPVFHIPGKNAADTTSLMKYYQIDDTYLDIHNCSTNNYWGRDASGKTLVGKHIRHHRFPFRKEVGKPLVVSTGTSSNVTRYRLKANIALNPSWTPNAAPDDTPYPKDSNGDPALIDYAFKFKVNGSGTFTDFNGQLTDDDIGVDIVVYDDTTDLELFGGVYGELEPTSQLAGYQVSGNERFVITYTHDSYILDSTINSDVSETFGISFSNIEKPRPDVVGFYIVRNERTDDDKLIVDNAIFGPTTQYQQYVSFGLINPKQYYPVNNCGVPSNSGKTLQYNDKTMWFFNPEFEYFGKKSDFDNVEVEGKYNQSGVIDVPTISDTENSACNGGMLGTKGVYIQDVQAGTSFNPSVNKSKNKDDDGFDLVAGYRNTNVTYALNDTLNIPAKDRIIYLNAASYQNYDSKTYYNVSVDNKIALYLANTSFDINELYNSTTKDNSLIYASLVKNNTSAYSNFMSRPYYKEHNNPVMFGTNNVVNDFRVFNGDARISAMHFISSVFYNMRVADRPKKSKLWQIVVGALLVVAAVVVTVASGGTGVAFGVSLGTAAITSLSALAISYGVSLAMTGIKFEQFKSMVDTDYDKGLKDTVTDGTVYETVRDSLPSRGIYNKDDDTIRWFVDRVSNIYIESSVPFGLRSGLTSGVTDFMDAPAPYNELAFRSYITEKLTTIDRDQGAGRLYKGYAGAEVYDMNLDYLRINQQKQFNHLSIEYDCCSDFNEVYPLRRWFSEQSFQEEKIDNYKVFLPNNYSDIEGEHGEITGLYRLGNNLFIHTVESLWQQPANIQERVTSEIVSFIGTGGFLSIPPRKVVDDALGSAGTQHKWATIKTKNGVFSLSELEGTIYVHGEKIDYMDKGMHSYFKENIRPFLSKQLYDNFGINFLNDNNPANPNGIGYISNYDTRFERILFTKRDYLIVAEKLSILKIVSSIPTDENTFAYNINDGIFYQGETPINLDNKDYFENKSFTISYSFHTASWTGWHSYLPSYYIHSRNSLYSYTYNDTIFNSLWKHNIEGSYGNFYGKQYPYIIEAVSMVNPIEDQIIEDLTLQTTARVWSAEKKHYVDSRYITFNKIWVYNSAFHSGELIMAVKEAKSSQSWYSDQLAKIKGEIIISKSGKDWNINGFKNFVIDYDKPLFSSSWSDLKQSYFIDKVINTDVIDFDKNWWELESFKDKYVIIRLIFDNFNNVNLRFNSLIATQQITD